MKATHNTSLSFPEIFLNKERNSDGKITNIGVQVEGKLNTAIMEDLKVGKIWSSISHEKEYALAFIVLNGK